VIGRTFFENSKQITPFAAIMCLMLRLARFGTLLFALPVFAQVSPGTLWNELKMKRDKLPGIHQEFEVSQTSRTVRTTQSSVRQIVVDMAPGQWRERSIAGSGDRIRIFDGKDLLRMEEGGDEFVRIKRKPKDDDPVPAPYTISDPDWPKATEKARRPCGLPGEDHSCVEMEVPLKLWARTSSLSNVTRMLKGYATMAIDSETGLMISLHTVQVIENRNGTYQTETIYALKRLGYGKALDPALFHLPSEGMREVKELTAWDAPRIRKELAGKPAPALLATDLQGKPVDLEALKGKTVLLDFWTTWCPPCRADAPSLDKLFSKYGGQNLVILGISVNEEHAIVEKYLKEHPHKFPVLLTSENDMPRPYQIGLFPTYVVIDPDGTISAAVQGDQGFADLKKLLKKAGLELD
jgi:thiol-disulfide isomerase/thioredoxin